MTREATAPEANPGIAPSSEDPEREKPRKSIDIV